MGYRPNILARSFSQRKTFTIGLVLPSIANPFYPEVAEAIEIGARQSEYQTVLCDTFRDHALGKQQMERLISRWVDGCIIMEGSLDMTDIAQYFHQGLPIVLCDWQEQETPPEIPHVRGDFFQAGTLAAQHFLELGHQHVAVIADEPGQTLRLQGFCSRFQEAGFPVPPEMIQQGNSTLNSGYSATQKLLTASTRPTAIFATTDLMAIGTLNAILDAGLRIPQDISLIGLDDINVSVRTRPALTSVGFPKDQLARAATDLLFAQIDGHNDHPALQLIEPYLAVRKSTTTPRNAQD
jgi:DNA-binding LacI/PurR family transcriptional regulator